MSVMEVKPGSNEPWLKCRYVAVLMGFTMQFFLYAQRIVVGVSILSMVNNSASTYEEDAELESCPDLRANSSREEHNSSREFVEKEGEFNWTPELQGYVLGGSFLFYALRTFPSGYLVELLGCKKILMWGNFLASVCTFISPFAAWGSVYLMIAVQSLRGLFQTGLFSALPFLLQFMTIITAGWLSDVLTNNKCMSIDTARKFWNNVACLGYSACLIGIYFAACNRQFSIIFGITSAAMAGFASAGCWIAAPDISPTFAGSIAAITCTIGLTSNFILPVIVGYLTNNMQTMEQWDKINFTSAGVVTLTTLVFQFFGSAEVQPWNDAPKDAPEKSAEEARF